MRIREIVETDLQALLRLYTQLHGNVMPEASEALLALWRSILNDPNHHIIVAVEGDEVLSSCVLVIVPNLTHGQRPYALVENVITDVGHRRQGLALACLEYARGVAERHRCYKMMLLTGSKEDGALDFYRRAGYNSEDKTAFVRWL